MTWFDPIPSGISTCAFKLKLGAPTHAHRARRFFGLVTLTRCTSGREGRKPKVAVQRCHCSAFTYLLLLSFRIHLILPARCLSRSPPPYACENCIWQRSDQRCFPRIASVAVVCPLMLGAPVASSCALELEHPELKDDRYYIRLYFFICRQTCYKMRKKATPIMRTPLCLQQKIFM